MWYPLRVTANAEPEDCARCLAAGMCVVITKPIEITGLCQAMERALAPDYLSLHTQALV